MLRISKLTDYGTVVLACLAGTGRCPAGLGRTDLPDGGPEAGHRAPLTRGAPGTQAPGFRSQSPSGT